MFKRIYIDNFRCFTNFEFVPGRINLLLGANGSGKTALFEVLTRVVRLVTRSLEVTAAFPVETRTRWEQRTAQRVELEMSCGGREFEYVLVIEHDTENGRPSIREEKVTSEGKTLFAFRDGHVHLHMNDGTRDVSFPFSTNHSFLAAIERRTEPQDLTTWLDFMSAVWAIHLKVRDIGSTSHEEQATFRADGSNFASWYRHFSQQRPGRLQPLWKSLEPILPGLQALGLSSDGGKGRVRELVAHMMVNKTEYQLDFAELSDGQRALIILYTLLEARSGVGCLLLDEPDLHVGLTEIQPWLVELDTRFADRGQIFLASQNPEVIDYMAASAPFRFERPDGGPARVRPAKFERESGLSASQQLARGLYDDK